MLWALQTDIWRASGTCRYDLACKATHIFPLDYFPRGGGWGLYGNRYSTKHTNSFLVNDQLDAQFFSIYLCQFSTRFEQARAHHQENQLYQYSIWHMSVCVGDIYQSMYWSNWFSWWWARGCSKHVENWNKYIEKNCASSWSFTKNHNEMHGQQN